MALLMILKRNDFLGVGKKLVTTESHTFLASKKYVMLIRREKIFAFNSFFKNRLTLKLFFFHVGGCTSGSSSKKSHVTISMTLSIGPIYQIVSFI